MNFLDRIMDDPFAAPMPRNICCNQGSSSSSSSQPTVPPGARPLSQYQTNTAMSASQLANPILMQSFGANPQGVAGLGTNEQALIQQITGQALNPADITSAEGIINQLTGGPIGSSPATQAGMNSFNLNVVPQEMTSQGMSGSGRGGGLSETLTKARAGAYVPLVQQEIQNRMQAVPELAALQQERQNLAQGGIQATDMNRQIRQAKLDAQYQDFLRRSGLAQQYTMTPQQILGELLGIQTSGSSSQGLGSMILPPFFNGIGQGLGRALG